ncbi:unnamed protein product [Closterium sp. NIES-54]
MPQAPHPPSPTPAVRSPLHQRSAQHARLHPPRAPILPPLPLKLPGVRFLRFRHLRNPPRISTIPPCLLPPRAGRKIRGERSFWATRGERGEVGEMEKAEDGGERAGGTTTEGHGQVQGGQFLLEWRQWGAAAYPSPLFLAALSPFSCFQELEKIVQAAHREGRPIRPVGSAISPNGIALSAHGMVNLALMDRVVHVDKSTGRVRMQAGARVEQVVEALRPHGLTLQNYASVREQQIGGFIQVSSRGCIG